MYNYLPTAEGRKGEFVPSQRELVPSETETASFKI